MTHSKSERMHRDKNARRRRKISKSIVESKTFNFFRKLRKMRKK